MIKSKKVFIHSICCLRRRIDTENIYKYFIKNGYELVGDVNDANYIILVTCGFIQDTQDLCIDAVKKFKKYDAELIVAGCLPNIAKDRLSEVFDGKIIPTDNLQKIDEYFKDNEVVYNQIEPAFCPWNNKNDIIRYKNLGILLRKILKSSKFFNNVYNWLDNRILFKIPLLNKIYAEKQFEKKYYSGFTILIARGCIHNCSYCAIKKGVGSLKSKSVEECINEFKHGLKMGFKDFVFEADDVGVYGIDINSNLPKLLKEVTNIPGEYKIRLGVTHPTWILKYMSDFKKVLNSGKISGIVISIQSGNTSILKLMRRNYSKDDIIEVVKNLKSADNNLEIGAQFIVGFPGETNEEFKDTYNILKNMHFNYGGVFKYSDVIGTESNTLTPKVTEGEMKKRMKLILKLLKSKNRVVWDSGRGISFFD